MKEKKEAAFYYHHPEYKFNCAEAITYKWEGSEQLVAQMKKCGGGRANKGYCGALHGALMLLQESQQQEDMIASFTKAAGSPKCHEIRKSGTISCKTCVDIADKLLLKLNGR